MNAQQRFQGALSNIRISCFRGVKKHHDQLGTSVAERRPIIEQRHMTKNLGKTKVLTGLGLGLEVVT